MKTIAFALLGALLAALPLQAQEWPTRTVKIVVPFGAGSTPDSLARIVADHLQKSLGQPFVIENKPGASGNLGTDAVAKADPDGYTLGVSIGGPLAINTLLFPKLPYNPATDLNLVTILASQPSVLVVNNSLGVQSVEDLVALLKREPGKYNYGSIGNGSLSHLAMEAISMQSGTQFVHVPYGGSPQAVTALLRGDVHMACLPAGSVVPQASAGQLKMLAITSAQRSTMLPDLKTLKEIGIANVEADAWVGLIAPAGTSEAIVKTLQKAVAEALHDPQLVEKLKGQFMEPVGNTSQQFHATVAADQARWKPVIESRHIKIE